MMAGSRYRLRGAGLGTVAEEISEAYEDTAEP
jgi:hypothetical protein